MASWSRFELEPETTTLALRGVSNVHNRDSILQLLDTACGSSAKYNFVFMPLARSSHAGLAIVNFVDAASCARCFVRLRQMQDQGLMVGVKSVARSYIQGFAENLAYYVVISQTDSRVTERPRIFVEGKEGDDALLAALIEEFVTEDLKLKAAERLGEVCRAFGVVSKQRCPARRPARGCEGCAGRAMDVDILGPKKMFRYKGGHFPLP
ncbi:Riboflavin biosynthesis protein RibBA [Durusdinium trenchii]|uniref:Riboflavin biosynthesis protein RibBA n=1 Tax=Durusdinium trenchii TaxID=1381693 RepID=A0ABP0HID5_9DINO